MPKCQARRYAEVIIDPRGGLEEKGAYKGRLVGRELNVEVFFFFSPFFYLTGMSLGRFYNVPGTAHVFFSNCRDKW